MTPVHEERVEAVLVALRDGAVRTVLDLGCGEGDLLVRLAQQPRIERLVGIDQSREALERLRTRLRDLHAEVRERVELVCGSMMEPRPALNGFDAAVLLETIEHLEPSRLSLLERSLFGEMRPCVVVITTPNADFNASMGMPRGAFRHPDHRFEWGRARFRAWAGGVAARNCYDVRCSDLVGSHAIYGGASQMATFRQRRDRSAADGALASATAARRRYGAR